MLSWQQGYRDDGDAGLLSIGARWYVILLSVGGRARTSGWAASYRPLSLNRYLYCEDDPVNAVDPSGRMAQWIKGIGAALAIGEGAAAGIGGAVEPLQL